MNGESAVIKENEEQVQDEEITTMNAYAEKVLDDTCMNKRVDIADKNLKRIKIIIAADDSIDNMKDKDRVSVVINKAIEYYFKSDDVQQKISSV